MPPTLADRIRHILAAIADVEMLLAGKTQADYETDRTLQLATEGALEIVCEASRHIPANVKARAPGIAWPRGWWISAIACVMPITASTPPSSGPSWKKIFRC
jgi:uncharacterized protein with HEPN domain